MNNIWNLPPSTVRLIRSRRQFGFNAAAIAAETGLSIDVVLAVLSPSKLAASRQKTLDAERRRLRALAQARRRVDRIRDELVRAGCTRFAIDQAFGLHRNRRPLPLTQQPRVSRS